ncbi:plastid fibrillin 3, partial [Haematococcus lacustris]
QLLEVIAPLKRGAAASAEDMAEVEQACRALEAVNPTRNPLSSPLVNGKWELLYTTSASILGTSRPPFLRPSGPIYQTIDAPAGKARNQETAPFFNTVAADITPMSSSKLAVKFTQFKLLGLLPITAPDSARGELAVTFLDEELRISRGDKGNLFVLRMADRDGKP